MRQAGGLEQALPSLQALARGLLGRDLRLQPLEAVPSTGMPWRPVLSTTHLLLPGDGAGALPAFDQGHALQRAAVAHAVAHLRFSPHAMPAKGLKPMTVALVSAIEDARVEHLLVRDHPGMLAWFLAPLRAAVKPRDVGFAGLLSRMDLALMDPHGTDHHPWVTKARALFEQQDTDLQDHAGFRRIAFILAHDLGQTRVPFRPQQYVVSSPHRDDNTYLWAHPVPEVDPPSELALSVPGPPPPLAQASPQPDDPAPPAVAEEQVLSRHLYPEWDGRLALLRPAWCTVIEKAPSWRQGAQASSGGPAPAPPLTLRRTPGVNQGRRLRRQRDGDELDLSAVIDFVADRRSGRPVEARCFTRLATPDTPASILILLDLSQSTGERVGASGVSFLDIEKRAALMLAEAARVRGDRIAIHGFASNTRAEVSYYRLLRAGEALDDAARAVLASAPARHSTRVGAALRHATASLAGEPPGLKAILLVTDGEPSDLDVHHPRYLVEDARQAAFEARAAGVQVHGLAVDPQGQAYARRIFGGRHHHLVDDPLSLPARLCGLYRALTAA